MGVGDPPDDQLPRHARRSLLLGAPFQRGVLTSANQLDPWRGLALQGTDLCRYTSRGQAPPDLTSLTTDRSGVSLRSRLGRLQSQRPKRSQK
jgi:hypothetical protein